MENAFANLELSTPSDREIRITRLFDAPRAMVFECYTRPELLKRWLGVQNGWTLEECEIDLTVGGGFRYLWRGPGGMEMGMRGVYKEINMPERIVSTERFDQSWYAGEAEGMVTFVERDRQTTATTRILYGSRGIRDSVLKTPMADGMERGYRQLDGLLTRLRAEADGKKGN